MSQQPCPNKKSALIMREGNPEPETTSKSIQNCQKLRTFRCSNSRPVFQNISKHHRLRTVFNVPTNINNPSVTMKDALSTSGSLQPLVKGLSSGLIWVSLSRYVSLSLCLRYLNIHSLWGIGYGAEAEAEEVPWHKMVQWAQDLKE